MIRVFAFVLVLALASPSSALAEEDRWFAHDKALHFGAGAALGAGGFVASTMVFETPAKRFASGLTLGLGAGAAKEWWDRGHDGDPSWRDFAWDGVGAAAGATIVWLIDRARHRQDSPSSPSRRQSGIGPAKAGHYVPVEGVILPVRR